MTIGQRILAAREASGLSQRQLAGNYMTRNMLSFLEHDKAKPSLDTLLYLSGMLGRPVGYFLGEDLPRVDGFGELCRARDAYDRGMYRECLEELKQIPDGEVLGRETALLMVLARLSLAEQALNDGRIPYARELLAQTQALNCPYWTKELRRRLACLLARAENRPGMLTAAVARIEEDDVLLLRAQAALEEGRYEDARRYLQALDHRDAQWHYRMGEALFGLKDYARAAECYHVAETTMKKTVRRRLQLCYAELKDFEKAYHYATMEE